VLNTARDPNRGVETNTGNLVTDAYLDAYDRYAPAAGLPARDATVVAIQNGGGIRQNAGNTLPTTGTAPGDITRKNTLDVLSFFTNAMTVVEDVTPTELKDIMERSVSTKTSPTTGTGGQFLQIAGMTVVADTTKQAQVITTGGVVTTPGQRIQSIMLADGTKIIDGGVVQAGAPNVDIVTNSFTAGGGDIYPWLAPKAKVNLGALYEQVWVEYMLSFPVGISGLPTIPATDPRYAPGGEGRITFL
jgi:hypothetical protein